MLSPGYCVKIPNIVSSLTQFTDISSWSTQLEWVFTLSSEASHILLTYLTLLYSVTSSLAFSVYLLLETVQLIVHSILGRI